MDNASTKMTDKKNKFDIFGKYVPSEVRSIAHVKTQQWVKWTVQNSLYTAQCENPLHVQQTMTMAIRNPILCPNSISSPFPFSPSCSPFGSDYNN